MFYKLKWIVCGLERIKINKIELVMYVRLK